MAGSSMRLAPTIGGSWAELLTSLPLNSTTMSPGRMPAFEAGPSGMTRATRAPEGRCMPKDSASSRVTSWISTPR